MTEPSTKPDPQSEPKSNQRSDAGDAPRATLTKPITRQAELEAACRHLMMEPFITVDTEFMRDSTFWPQLCLIQLGCEEAAYAVDPLAEGIDLAPFFDLMSSPQVLKVFHAARQDLEIIYHLSGRLPHPVFDTQVAAMVCGFGDQVGYETLVRKLADQALDKSSRFTDWSRRPLSKKQIDYALADVTHLRVVFEKLDGKLQEAGRHSWLEEEMAILTAEDTYRMDPADAWTRFKLKNVKPSKRGVLMEVAAWREKEAQSRDIPRQRVLKDDAIYDISNQAPKDKAGLESLRGVPKGFGNSRAAEGLLAAIAAGKARDPETFPKLNKAGPPPPGADAIADLLKVLLKERAGRHDVAPRMIATAADLDRLAAEDEPDVPALSGWRRKIFGEDALALKSGALALGLIRSKKGTPRVSVFPVPEGQDE